MRLLALLNQMLANTAVEHAERLAMLMTLSYEPMLAWRLDGPIEFWNAGAARKLSPGRGN